MQEYYNNQERLQDIIRTAAKERQSYHHLLTLETLRYYARAQSACK